MKRGEGGTTLLLALNIFLLLFAYYLLKVTREPLILRHGADFKTYASSFQAITLMPALIGFAWASQHVPRVKLIGLSTMVISSMLLVFYWLVRVDSPWAGPAFFVFVGVMPPLGFSSGSSGSPLVRAGGASCVGVAAAIAML